MSMTTSRAIERPLVGQLAIVTGAAQGIGRVIGEELLDRGADLAAIDFQDFGPERFLDGRDQPQGSVHVYQCDVTSSPEVDAVCAQIERDLGAPAILVNNAGGSGVRHIEPVEAMEDEVWDGILSLNLTSIMRLCRRVVPMMTDRGYGRIVNISSTLKDGVFGPVETMGARLPYIAAKSAIVGLTRQLAKDLGPSGITVNAIAPGLTLPGEDARVTQRFNAMPEEAQRRLTAHIPVGRPASGRDIANAVAFLAMPESGYVNGQILAVDGGA